MSRTNRKRQSNDWDTDEPSQVIEPAVQDSAPITSTPVQEDETLTSADFDLLKQLEARFDRLQAFPRTHEAVAERKAVFAQLKAQRQRVFRLQQGPAAPTILANELAQAQEAERAHSASTIRNWIDRLRK